MTTAPATAAFERWQQREAELPDWSVSAVRAYQLARVQRQFRHLTAHSRFYRRLLAHIPEPTNWSQVRRLPFTTPEDLRAEPSDFLCVGQQQVARIVTLHTSGTSGRPKRLFFSPADLERTVRFFHHGMALFTAPGDRVCILMPGETAGSVGDLLSRGLRRLGAHPFCRGLPADAGETAAALLETEAQVAVGMPFDLYRLACSDRAEPIRRAGALRCVLLCADYVTDAIAQTISRNLGCQVQEHYGMTETAYRGGVTCHPGGGYHLLQQDFCLEILHPQTGTPVPPGEYGEIVLTTLCAEAMPLLRYRTGDIGRMRTEGCACGSVFPVLDRVTCRLGDCIATEEGLVLLPELESAVWAACPCEDFALLWSPASHTLTVSLLKPEGSPGEMLDALRRQRTIARLESSGCQIRLNRMARPQKRTSTAQKRRLHLTDNTPFL